MRVFVAGCKGQLGIELIRQLSKDSNEIIETDIHNLDICDINNVVNAVNNSLPDVIVNCAAYTNVDSCESNEDIAFRVNSIGARNLSIAAQNIGKPIVQISTDYVFDGKGNIQKREYDFINPQSVYGKSKAFGEKLVIETNPKHFILRTAWLYGAGNNFVRTMLKLSKQQDTINVVDDQIGTPTSTVDLAKSIIELIQTENYGTYHATCDGQCSWYDFAVRIFEMAHINVRINRITTEQLSRPAPRPMYSVLENYMLNLIGMNSFRPWEDSLKEYLQQEV